MRLAVLMTCHNRRDTTVACLQALLSQLPHPLSVTVFLVDDGSTDGTGPAVAAFPQVRLIEHPGGLYWAAGMALAEECALATNPDAYLWLNDDTILDPDAIQRLAAQWQAHPNAILVGAVRDPVSSEVTYGGRLRTSRWHPQRFDLLTPSSVVQPCDTFHGNVVLVPATVWAVVGGIDGHFPHAYADDDYGLRACAAGIPVLQCPGTVGTCPRGVSSGGAPGVRGWLGSQQPKGQPLRAQIRYFARHGGPTWPFILAAQQVRRLVRGG